MTKKAYSTNERAHKLLGKRPTDSQPIDFPAELGYKCPMDNINYDEALQWSEYEGFLWCERCNIDIPTPLCVPLNSKKNIARATDIFLDIIERIGEK